MTQIIIPKGEESKAELPTKTVEEIAAETAEATRLAEETAEKAKLEGAEGGDEGKTGDEGSTEVDKVLIDEVEYTLDKDGNALKEDGTIHLTKEALDALEASSTEESLITTVQKHINVIPVDETGKPIEYEDSVAGVAKYNSDVAVIRANQLAKDYIDTFFKKNPNVYGMFLHEQKTGTTEGYQSKVSWKDFDITNATEDDLKTIVQRHRKALGDDDATIKYLIEKHVAEKTLNNYASTLVNSYVTAEEKEATEAQALLKKQEDDAKEENTKYWNKVQAVITSGKVAIGDETVTIPEVLRVKDKGVVKTYTRNDFYKYLYDQKEFTINNQKHILSQHQYDETMEMMARNENHDILDALKRFLKNDLSQVISTTLKEHEVRKIKSFSTKTGNTSTTSTPTGGKIIIKRN